MGRSINKALVIAPHADDETFGCGGTIAKLTFEMVQVDLLLGSLGYDNESHTIRRKELDNAVDILGINNYKVITHIGAERYQDRMPQYGLIDAIEKEIQDHDLVFIPYPSHHQDHIAMHRACMAALRPGAMYQPKMILMYEYTYPTWEVPDQYNGRLFVDISYWIDKKIGAILAYNSQLRGEYNPVSIRSSKIMAKSRGLSIGVDCAEMFYVIQMKDIL